MFSTRQITLIHIWKCYNKNNKANYSKKNYLFNSTKWHNYLFEHFYNITCTPEVNDNKVSTFCGRVCTFSVLQKSVDCLYNLLWPNEFEINFFIAVYLLKVILQWRVIPKPSKRNLTLKFHIEKYHLSESKIWEEMVRF